MNWLCLGINNFRYFFYFFYLLCISASRFTVLYCLNSEFIFFQGVYALLFCKRSVRSVGYRLAGSMGKLRYFSLSSLIVISYLNQWYPIELGFSKSNFSASINPSKSIHKYLYLVSKQGYSFIEKDMEDT